MLYSLFFIVETDERLILEGKNFSNKEEIEKIAEKSQISVKSAKEAVNRSFETTLAEGLLFERRIFHSMFATEDQKEGMSAFLEKRDPQFRDK